MNNMQNHAAKTYFYATKLVSEILFHHSSEGITYVVLNTYTMVYLTSVSNMKSTLKCSLQILINYQYV